MVTSGALTAAAAVVVGVGVRAVSVAVCAGVAAGGAVAEPVGEVAEPGEEVARVAADGAGRVGSPVAAHGAGEPAWGPAHRQGAGCCSHV
ncbi:hypothetical protein [Mycolicibacterium sp. YH-1]|uniref:hypothetical protein n=1 Tax=Mycolicibacterium sp. YH-1 TaxID=2908837 RepID=UPI001F4BE134|nr:hypothetical protein [Mycolicibacterium sp. YH-1]UNB56396.1 hypothetical protein L0M16_01425 [Mycolicibacterium sp. YH-1]